MGRRLPWRYPPFPASCVFRSAAEDRIQSKRTVEPRGYAISQQERSELNSQRGLEWGEWEPAGRCL